MWLSLLLLALLLVIAFSQSTQGLFSAFIMTVLAICCAAAAFGTHEWVATHWLAPHWRPDYALPIALGVTFGLPLLLLRLAFDRVIRRPCLLPAWADRIGGAVCGLVTALIMVGILAICLQMIPFGGSLLGYARVTVASSQGPGAPGSTPPDPGAKERELLPILPPDRFAAAVASVLSEGTFSGKYSFYQHNPDLIRTVGWVGATRAEVSRYAPPKSISIVDTKPVQFVYRMIPPADPRGNERPTHEPQPPEKENHEFHMVRVQLHREARDSHKSYLFTLRQFRLVGQPAGGGAPEQYHPIAIQQEDAGDPTNRHIRYKKNRGRFWPVIDDIYTPRDQDNQVEFVFELPRGFTPEFIEYKREARAAFSSRRQGPGRRASAPVTDSEPTRPGRAADQRRSRGSRRAKTAADSGRGGTVRAVAAAPGQSRFSDELPLTMRSYRRLKDAAISKGALVDGHLLGAIDRQENGRDPPVGKFDVPPDKRLLQLNSRRLQSRSAVGRAINRATATVQNYVVMDANGKRYKVVGKYAIADVRGRKHLEIQYFSSPVGTIGGLGAFSRIDESKLKPDDEFVLLFLVDPGARIVSFSNGGSASRQDDLTGENLVAPP